MSEENEPPTAEKRRQLWWTARKKTEEKNVSHYIWIDIICFPLGLNVTFKRTKRNIKVSEDVQKMTNITVY